MPEKPLKSTFNRGMTTIPKKVREKMKLQEGDILLWQIRGDNEAAIKKVMLNES